MIALADAIASAPELWLADGVSDVSAFGVDANTPTEVSTWLGGSPALTAWAKLTVDVRTAVRITSNASSITDTVMWLFSGIPSSGSSSIAMNDDGSINRWSEIDITLDPGVYYVLVTPYLDSGSFSFATANGGAITGKHIAISVRPLVGTSIKIEGEQVIEDVEYREAYFLSQANGVPGSCRFRIRDLLRELSMSAGSLVTVDYDGVRTWAGFALNVRRGYYSDGKALAARYLEISGPDINVLFRRRVLYDKSNPATTELTVYPAGTDDRVMVVGYMENHLDLLEDRVSVYDVQTVASPSLDVELGGDISSTFGQFMDLVRRNLGTIYYLTPELSLVYADTETTTAAFEVSDQPGSGQRGVQDLEIVDQGGAMVNDALIWGAGQGSDGVVFSRSKDQDSIDAYGLWQVGLFTQSVFRQSTVDRISDSYVNGSLTNRRGGKDPQPGASFTIFEPGLLPGQVLIVDSKVYERTETLPIRSLRLSFSSGIPKWEIIAAQIVDEPWSTFEWLPITLPPIDVTVPQIEIALPRFDPCGPFEVVCREDTFNGRTVGGAWGTPSDGGSDWVNYTGAGENGLFYVISGEGIVSNHGSYAPSGSFVQQSWYGYLPTDDCTPADEVDIYFTVRANGRLYGNPDPSAPYEVAVFSSGNSKEVFQVIFGGLGDSIAIFGDTAHHAYFSLGQSGSTYYHTPYDLGGNAKGPWRVHIHCTSSGSSANIWDSTAHEPDGYMFTDTGGGFTGPLQVRDQVLVNSGYTLEGNAFYLDDLKIIRTYSGSGGGAVCETFTRTVSNGLGVSEIGGGNTYNNDGSSGIWSADGSETVGTRYTAPANPGAYVALDNLAYPIRAQFDVHFTAQGSLRVAVVLDSAHIVHNGGVGAGAYYLDIVAANSGAWTITIRALDGTGAGRILAVSSAYFTMGSTYTFQLYLTPTLIAAKWWQLTFSEPSDVWTDRYSDSQHLCMDGTVAATWSMGTLTLWNWVNSNSSPFFGSVGDPFFTIDNFCFPDQTAPDPCDGPTPPAPDPPGGLTCLEPVALASPPDAAYQYFNVGGSYQPGSSELYLVTPGVGGIFLRPGYDYTEIYSAGWIGVDNAIDMTGKTLWFCAYYEPIYLVG